MEKILEMLAHEQSEQREVGGGTEMTILLHTGEKVVGIIGSVADGVVSIYRRTAGWRVKDGAPLLDAQYADTPRHYSTSAVIGAYYTDGS